MKFILNSQKNFNRITSVFYKSYLTLELIQYSNRKKFSSGPSNSKLFRDISEEYVQKCMITALALGKNVHSTH
jgi:hypothetical protein